MPMRNHETPSAKTRDPMKGQGGGAADAAVDGNAHIEDHQSTSPSSRKAEPLRDEKYDQLAEKQNQSEDRQEALLDEGLEESFPSSDPVSVKRIT